jgi:hypothetical protein
MAFKPLTVNKTALVSDKKEESAEAKESLGIQTLEQILATTTERIHIIYDDSGSMETRIESAPGMIQSTQELAAEATIEYMKNCKPHVTAVEIAPLNENPLALTKNLPKLSIDLKAIQPSGGTPIFGFIEKLVNAQPTKKYTRALIFTDGQPTDYDYHDIPVLMAKARALEIPIDFIVISAYPHLAETSEQIKKLAEDSGGTYMNCKDGKSFKEKMKFFAPLLRHMLPSVASKDERG